MTKRTFAIASLLALLGSAILVGTVAVADDDEEEGHHRPFATWNSLRRGVAPVTNEQYQTECSSCHMAYPPGLLPARSWQKIMATLDQHFGDNADLDPETGKALETYLVANSADTAKYRVSAKFNRMIKANDTPLRISQTSYFVAKHEEVPERAVKGNPKVKSFANCDACHTHANDGSFNEHEVRVPGFERSHF